MKTILWLIQQTTKDLNFIPPDYTDGGTGTTGQGTTGGTTYQDTTYPDTTYPTYPSYTDTDYPPTTGGGGGGGGGEGGGVGGGETIFDIDFCMTTEMHDLLSNLFLFYDLIS